MGHFIHKTGYEMVKIPYHGTGNPPSRYQVTMQGLSWIDRGVPHLTARTFTSDLGSIPAVAQWFIRDDRFLLSFLFHDSAYQTGGWWIMRTYIQLTRSEADALLHDMIISEGGTQAQAWAIWLAVRMFGAKSWRGK